MFQEILDAIWKWDIFLSSKWNVKIKLQTIIGNLLDKQRKLYMNGTVI